MFTEFVSIIELLAKFSTEQHCIDHLEAIRWNGQVVSPFDPKSKVYKCANNKYKCKETGKYFNVRTATLFEDTKLPLQKWFMALYLFASHKKGISSHQLAKDLDITQKSAWFVLHRLRYAFDHPSFKVQYVVEVDETFVAGKEKNKHANKKTDATHGRNTKTKSAVVGMVERGGNVMAQHVEKLEHVVVEYLVQKNVKKGPWVMTDDARSYGVIRNNFVHRVANHSAKQYVNGIAHTNTIEGFWSHFKRGLDGIYHQVSFRHLQRNAQEFALRYNTRRLRESRFNLVLANIVGRLRYQELTAKR